MNLKSIELLGFKSFAHKTKLEFKTPISAIVGPNGSGKSNIAEAFRFVLGEQSIKSMRGKKGEDLIFNGSRTTPKSNRASVKLIFDNKDKILNLDYDEVVLERIVHRDGTNQYYINKSIVRLKDIIELLSTANIGPTGHHIISQGESDRILSVNSKERKLMIEDALGLKIYFYKKKESVKKLEKTKQNIKEVQSLRREIKPHLRFLKKQVDKIKNTEVLKNKLKIIYKEYLKLEKNYLDLETCKITEAKKEPESRLEKLKIELENAEKILARVETNNSENKELFKIENSINDLRIQEQELIRDLGKIEGEIIFLDKIKINEIQDVQKSTVSFSSIENLNSKIEIITKDVEVLNDLSSAKEIIIKIKNIFSDFLLKNRKVNYKEKNLQNENFKRKQQLVFKKEKIEENINLIKDRMTNLNEQHKKINNGIESGHIEKIEAEKTILQIKAKNSEIKSNLNFINIQEKTLFLGKTKFEEAVLEAVRLIGKEILKYIDVDISSIDNDRKKQETRKKEIERIKIKLEDSEIGPSGEILNEYKETVDRDNFLEKEIIDLENSKELLNMLINNLEEKLNIEFRNGVKKTSEKFNEFFSSMFGGGSASIEIVKILKKKYIDEIDNLSIQTEISSSGETEDREEGLEINVSLPHKKIKSLNMLSGGERALTSIALTFAISQINPPPFVVLDETDAALDESNSKKYGDVIESLSKLSQLILITHNRETMSRAGILYGITLGSSGVSKTISIELDDAIKIAK